jgi:hypothetical protein
MGWIAPQLDFVDLGGHATVVPAAQAGGRYCED